MTTRKRATSRPVAGLVRKSDVIRLLNEYHDRHVVDDYARRVIHAIRHDVRALPNAEAQILSEAK